MTLAEKKIVRETVRYLKDAVEALNMIDTEALRELSDTLVERVDNLPESQQGSDKAERIEQEQSDVDNCTEEVEDGLETLTGIIEALEALI